MSVRVRFAPSPTGYLHIGGARTALFNWMFARHHGGQFILRIEDTDQKRTVPGAIEAIMDAMRWLGLDWDEGPDVGGPYGPYIQTQRADLYREWAYWLVEHGHAYKCFCTSEEVAKRRESRQGDQQAILGYDRHCRYLSAEEVAAKEAQGIPYVIRFKMPLEGTTTIPDIIRGDIVVDNGQVQDAVLLKSDGLPTYHLANVVDDHFMKITHILRADEWINTAPLHIHLYHAFGWDVPAYAHLPLVLNPSGKGKLSKRAQAFDDGGQQVLVKVEEFRDAGYLPEAVLNFLANVGWAFGEDREKFSMAEAIARFRLEDINPAPSRLPYGKLDWLNGQYIQEMESAALVEAVVPFLEKAGLDVSRDVLMVLADSMKPRLKRLSDAVDFLVFLRDETAEPLAVEQLVDKKLPLDAARAAFREALAIIQTIEPFSVDTLGEQLRAIGERHTTNSKAGPFLGKMRFAITRQRISPPLFESIVALGRERATARLEEAVKLLETA
ncbi:MAG: glutamate--tRNA ligase [Chloroflexi bacterium]|nr:MAG: glutamate--tRNA ligase [Chloroflexota bacterium]